MLKKAGLYKPKEKAKPAEPLPAESKSPYQAPKKKWRFNAAGVRSIWANIQHFSRKHRKALIACLIVVMALGSVVIATESRYGTKISGFNEIEIVEYRGNATSVEIPSRIYGMKVTRIGDGAFASHRNLESVTIPDGVTSIGSYAFSGCSSLKNITIPNGVTSLGDHTFQNCSNLKSITIPNSVTSIGSYAFSDCSSLKNITIPNSVKSIGDYAFSRCSSLIAVYYEGALTDWATMYKGSGNSSLTHATRYYYSETRPVSATVVKYWHYVDGVPTPW